MKNVWNPDTYSTAWDFATHAHHGQTFGGRTEGEHVPYLHHIASVAMEVMWALMRSHEHYHADLAIQCALLHDVIEDTDSSFDDIHHQFGPDVAAGVAALSKDPALPSKEQQMVDSLQRITRQPREIGLVKLADRITNLYHPPYYWTATRILAYQAESKTIAHALEGCCRILGNRLHEKIDLYAKYAEGRTE